MKKEFLSRKSTFRICLVLALFFFCAYFSGLGIYVLKESQRRSYLKPHNPSIVLLDRNGFFLDEIESSDHEYGYWPSTGTGKSSVIAKAFIAAEDKNFFNHAGPDIPAMVRAFFQNITTGKRVSGASTLTMQIVRLEYPAERTYLNKLIEALAATKMVKRYGHERLLSHYLTIVPFGNRYHGIACAAEKYFSKPASDLSVAEAAFLSAIPKSPVKLNPYSSSGYKTAISRAEYIIARMRQDGGISDADERKSLQILSSLKIMPKQKRPDYALHAILQMREEIERTGARKIIVRTGLDLGVQKELVKRASLYIANRRGKGAGNMAMIVADKKSREIIAYLGSVSFSDGMFSGSIDYARALRSSGSTLKPFLFALGMMEKGYTGATILPDLQMTFASGTHFYQPQNSDLAYSGPVLYRFALANSRNIPSLYLVREIGLFKSFDFFRRLGLVKERISAEHYGLGIAIGHLPVSLLDLVNAYGALANDGVSFNATFFPEKNQETKQLIPADIARLITIYLADPNARLPVFSRMGNMEYPFPVSVKTGTSQGYRDAWTIAYTKDYVIGIWTGNPDNSRMDGLTGINSSGHLMQEVISYLHEDDMNGLHDLTLPPPEGYVVRSISKLTGKLCDERSPDATSEYFKPGTEPEPERMNSSSSNSDGTKIRTIELASVFGDWASSSGMKMTTESKEILGQVVPQDPNDCSIYTIEPAEGSRYYISDILPLESQVIQLKGVIDPVSPVAVWYVDGRPYATAAYPYSISWPLQRGKHFFQLRMPSSPLMSKETSITVE